jgi:hypothetical protein
VEGASLYTEGYVRERNFTWDLAFACEEVIAGIARTCENEGYPYRKEDTSGETVFHVTFPDGSATLRLRPQDPRNPAFNHVLKFQRTTMAVSLSEAGPQTVETFHRQLTLAFLRAGG